MRVLLFALAVLLAQVPPITFCNTVCTNGVCSTVCTRSG